MKPYINSVESPGLTFSKRILLVILQLHVRMYVHVNQFNKYNMVNYS